MKKIFKRILISIILILLMSFAASVIYVQKYYHATDEAYVALESDDEIEVRHLADKTIAFLPKHPKAGLIFYPGGKVQYEAYAPLMKACAKEGIAAVLVHMPGNLAVLDMDAADGISEQFPEIEKWYIGGHSLGGAMASSYLSKHEKEYEGLVLLAAYSTADLKENNLEIVSIYGSEDHVLNQEKYQEYEENLPNDYTEHMIEGGCHAYFGCYGPQKGDGNPKISNEEQIQETAKVIAASLLN